MRSLFVLFFFLTLLAHGQTQNSIEGTWVTVSSFSNDGKAFPTFAQQIFNFEGDSVEIIELGNHASGNLIEINSRKTACTISINEVKIPFGTEMISYEYTMNDSLILTIQNYDRDRNYLTSIVLKRVDPTKSFNKTLAGSYLYKWPEDSSIINFVNDSLCIGMGRPGITKHKVYTYKGMSFFIYGHALWPVASIWNQDNDTTFLAFHLQPNRKITLTKAKRTIAKPSLLGEWLHYVDSSNLPPPPPLPMTESDSARFEVKLTIEADSIHFYYLNRVESTQWKLSEDGTIIYFPDKVFQGDGTWIIEEFIEGESMTIKKTNKAYQDFWFKKSKVTH